MSTYKVNQSFAIIKPTGTEYLFTKNVFTRHPCDVLYDDKKGCFPVSREAAFLSFTFQVERLFYYDRFVGRNQSFHYHPSDEIGYCTDAEDDEVTRFDTFKAHKLHVGCFGVVE